MIGYCKITFNKYIAEKDIKVYVEVGGYKGDFNTPIVPQDVAIFFRTRIDIKYYIAIIPKVQDIGMSIRV